MQRAGHALVAGIDEAGRGAWAGPVVAAAVILPSSRTSLAHLRGANDSKQLTSNQRDVQRRLIEAHALAWSVGSASSAEIDALGIVPATRLAMMRAITSLAITPHVLLIDAVKLPMLALPQRVFNFADSISLSVACASILAKTARDAMMYPYLAGHGYACVRVDMRGAGEADGILLDEYLEQEQNDALEVIAWIAAQPWCDGGVGMCGISWSGFNALQVAARRPPALKAIITMCSTDDRYADDVHYTGGCIGYDALPWASIMFNINAAPPDPRFVGERWRELWLARMAQTPPYIDAWLAHQTRDAYWRHGSVCENYAEITCPVYAIGGWVDGYTNAIPRLLAGLPGPRKGLIGPWSHTFPNHAEPGPAIGFLQEVLSQKFSYGKAVIIDSMFFALIHLFHHGFVKNAEGVIHFYPLSGFVWVVLMFCTALLFAWLRKKSGSLYPAITAHAVFNIVMNAAIFYGM